MHKLRAREIFDRPLHSRRVAQFYRLVFNLQPGAHHEYPCLARRFKLHGMRSRAKICIFDYRMRSLLERNSVCSRHASSMESEHM